MEQEKKNIAVYMPQIYSEYERQLRKGIEEEAAKRGFHLLFFTSLMDNSSFESSGKDNEDYIEGERAVFYLADFNRVDAVILLYDAFAHKHWNELFDIVDNRCRCPVINFRTPLKGAYNIYVDDDKAFSDLIHHFIQVHHARRINLLTGPKENIHSLKRLEIYKKALEEHGIAYEEERVYYGNFWRNCGEDALEAFLSSGLEMPEAVVCANDYMAISLIQALERRRIHVPEMVKVSGYDNLEESKYHWPSLTTVRQPVESMGRKSVEIAERLLAGEVLEKEIYLPSEVIYRQSCGCGNLEKHRMGSYATVLAERINEMAYLDATSMAMTTFMANASNFDEFIKCVEEYVLLDTGFKDFVLCLAEGWEQQIPVPKSLEDRQRQKMEMVVGLYRGKKLEPETFSMRTLLPRALLEQWDDPYYIFPLHYLQYYLGYAIVTVRKNVPDSAAIRAWFAHLENALENIRIRGQMESMIQELRTLYDKDTLTGLYNRRGIDSIGIRYYNECLIEKKQLLVLEIDMDGLKQINDRYGHLEGDIGICTIAEAMQHSAVHDEICIRSGGDEFVLIGRDYTEEKLDALLQSFYGYLEQKNIESSKPYSFAASVGYYMRIPDGTENLEEYIKKADAAMYQEKKQHKARRE